MNWEINKEIQNEIKKNLYEIENKKNISTLEIKEI